MWFTDSLVCHLIWASAGGIHSIGRESACSGGDESEFRRGGWCASGTEWKTLPAWSCMHFIVLGSCEDHFAAQWREAREQHGQRAPAAEDVYLDGVVGLRAQAQAVGGPKEGTKPRRPLTFLAVCWQIVFHVCWCTSIKLHILGCHGWAVVGVILTRPCLFPCFFCRIMCAVYYCLISTTEPKVDVHKEQGFFRRETSDFAGDRIPTLGMNLLTTSKYPRMIIAIV